MRSTDSILEALDNPKGPQRLIIRSLPGAGVRDALEGFVAAAATRGLVLILVPFKILGEQWTERLLHRGVEVHFLRSPSDALHLRSIERQVRPRGVVVATFPRARHSQVRKALANYELELVLFDGVAGGPPESLRHDDFLTAAKEVALVTGTSPFEWEGAETLPEVTEQEFDAAASDVVVTTINYENSAHHTKPLDDARRFLDRFANSDQAEARSASGAALYEMLLRVATGAISATNGTSQDEERAWRLAEQIEDADTIDGQLTALDNLLSDHPDIDKWIISVVRRSDAYYVHDHLRARGIDAVVLTADVSQLERQEVLASGASVIIATTAILRWLPQWPRGYAAVWWNPPPTRLDYESRMSLLATAGHAQVFQLSPH